MYKLNNDNIITGYIKQLLHSFNFPKCKLFKTTDEATNYYKNLSSDYMISFREEVLNISGNARSFDLLEAIIKNINDVLKYDYDNNGKILNYYRIMIKCSIFDKLS